MSGRGRRPRAAAAWAALALAAALAVAAAAVRCGDARSVGSGEGARDDAAGETGAPAALLGEALGTPGASEPVRGDVPDAAARVLERYAGRGDCVLTRSGYLGVLGDSWGCVAYGGDWSEVCVVKRVRKGESEVLTWRFDADDLARELVDGHP